MDIFWSPDFVFFGVMRVPFRVENPFHLTKPQRKQQPSNLTLTLTSRHPFFSFTTRIIFLPVTKGEKRDEHATLFYKKEPAHFLITKVDSSAAKLTILSLVLGTLKNEREEKRLSFISETMDPKSCQRNKRWKRVKIPSVTQSNRRRSQNLGFFLLEILFHIPSQDRHRALAHVVRSLTHNRSTASHIRFLLVGSSLPILRWKSSSSLTLMILYLSCFIFFSFVMFFLYFSVWVAASPSPLVRFGFSGGFNSFSDVES